LVSKRIKAKPFDLPSSFFNILTDLTSPNYSSKKFPISFSSALKLRPFTITSKLVLPLVAA